MVELSGSLIMVSREIFTEPANCWIGVAEANYLHFKSQFFVYGYCTTNRIEDPNLIVSECTSAEQS
jgi:hypothetical protein